jgi:hypothetical protein
MKTANLPIYPNNEPPIDLEMRRRYLLPVVDAAQVRWGSISELVYVAGVVQDRVGDKDLIADNIAHEQNTEYWMQITKDKHNTWKQVVFPLDRATYQSVGSTLLGQDHIPLTDVDMPHFSLEQAMELAASRKLLRTIPLEIQSTKRGKTTRELMYFAGTLQAGRGYALLGYELHHRGRHRGILIKPAGLDKYPWTREMRPIRNLTCRLI